MFQSRCRNLKVLVVIISVYFPSDLNICSYPEFFGDIFLTSGMITTANNSRKASLIHLRMNFRETL